MSDREPLTDAELDRIEAEARTLAAWKAALGTAPHDFEGAPWRVVPPDDPRAGVWGIDNDAPHARDRYDILEDPSEAVVNSIVAARNGTAERDVLRLVEEIRRLRLELAALRAFKSPDGWDRSLVGSVALLAPFAPGTFVACTSDAPRRATPGVPETRPDEDD